MTGWISVLLLALTATVLVDGRRHSDTYDRQATRTTELPFKDIWYDILDDDWTGDYYDYDQDLQAIDPWAPQEGASRTGGLKHQAGLTLCPPGEWLFNHSSLTQCRRCSECPAGTGVRKPCSAHHDVDCQPCPIGVSFSMEVNGQRECLPCSDCQNRHVQRYCSMYEDAICGRCKEGHFYDDVMDACRPCSYCQPGSGIEVSECASQPHENRCYPSVKPRPGADDQDSSEAGDADGDSAVQHSEFRQLLTTDPSYSKWLTLCFAAISFLAVFVMVLSAVTLYCVFRLRRDVRQGVTRNLIYRGPKNAPYSSLMSVENYMDTDSGIQD